jgi:serine/threonine-protein kinase
MDWGLAKDLTGSASPVASHTPTALAVWPEGADAVQTADYRPPSGTIEDQTQAGTILGTPSYMAPEVVAGDAATPAADVYGLGAILHTLLAGRPPYEGKTAPEVLQKVVNNEPALFADAKNSVPPALVAICRKAMARNPTARYASAEDVGADVRRWLSGEPVTVYREPWTGRAARWARGRKTAVVASGVLLLTTAIAATVTAGLVWREQRQTKVQWERAETETIKATENAETAKTVVHDLSRYIQQVELAGDRQSVTDQQRKRTLDQALPGYERLLALHPDDVQLRSTTALMHRFRANLCRVLGELLEAERSYLEALRRYGELIADRFPYEFDLAMVGRDFSLLLKTSGRLKESAAVLDSSIRRLEDWSADSDRPKIQSTLAMMLLDRAELDYLLGSLGETERHARRSAELYALLAEKAPEAPETLRELFHGMAEIRLAVALRELGRFEEAISVHDQVIERFAGILKLQTSVTRSYTFEYHRAQAEKAWTLAQVPSRRASGLADLDSAIAGFEKLARQFPQFPAYPRSQGMGTFYRGRLKALLGQREGAVQDLNAATKIFEGLVAKFQEVPVYRSYLGQCCMALGQLDAGSKKSAEWYRKGREMLDTALQRSPENAQDRKALADLDALTKVPIP